MRTYKVNFIVQEKDSFEEKEAILHAFDYNDAKQMCEDCIKSKDWESYANLMPNFEEPTLTLRDQFACAAMNLINSNDQLRKDISLHSFEERINYFAKTCYQVADACLAERDKK